MGGMLDGGMSGRGPRMPHEATRCQGGVSGREQGRKDRAPRGYEWHEGYRREQCHEIPGA
jgi:hypothetical protein